MRFYTALINNKEEIFRKGLNDDVVKSALA